MSDYDGLQTAAERPPKRLSDHTAAWLRLEPVSSCNGTTRDRIEHFCETKRITVAALEALGTRVKVDRHGSVELAFAYPANRGNGHSFIPALKFRPLGDKPRYAAEPSTYLEPLVVGNRDSMDWFVAEGETDAARLWALVGDAAAIALPARGRQDVQAGVGGDGPAWRRRASLPRRRRAGDEGAAKAAAVLGGRTVRVRPPSGNDWCEWDGDRERFVELVAAARQAGATSSSRPLGDFLAHHFPAAEPLLGEPGAVYLAVGSLLLVYGTEGSGKSTWTIDAIAHLAAGRDWLGIPVPRPVRFLVIENEGPPSLFQNKLERKAASWDGDPWRENVHVFTGPWGEFTLRRPRRRDGAHRLLRRARDRRRHREPHARARRRRLRPPRRDTAVRRLARRVRPQDRPVRSGSSTTRTRPGRYPATGAATPTRRCSSRPDGNRPRTKLVWEKTRWATLPADEHPKTCMLEWVVETEGYNVVELDTVGASDDELRAASTTSCASTRGRPRPPSRPR